MRQQLQYFLFTLEYSNCYCGREEERDLSRFALKCVYTCTLTCHATCCNKCCLERLAQLNECCCRQWRHPPSIYAPKILTVCVVAYSHTGSICAFQMLHATREAIIRPVWWRSRHTSPNVRLKDIRTIDSSAACLNINFILRMFGKHCVISFECEGPSMFHKNGKFIFLLGYARILWVVFKSRCSIFRLLLLYSATS